MLGFGGTVVLVFVLDSTGCRAAKAGPHFLARSAVEDGQPGPTLAGASDPQALAECVAPLCVIGLFGGLTRVRSACSGSSPLMAGP